MTDLGTSRRHFPDGSSINLNLDTVTFAITLPTMTNDCDVSLVAILHCLCRTIHTAPNPTVANAVKGLFDVLYDRAVDRERAVFPAIFDSVRSP